MIRQILESINESQDTLEQFVRAMTAAGWEEDRGDAGISTWTHRGEEGIDIVTMFRETPPHRITNVLVRLDKDTALFGAGEQYEYELLQYDQTNAKGALKAVRQIREKQRAVKKER